MDKELTLAEIRKAQAEIIVEMSKNGLTRSNQKRLEQASFHLRNIERLLVSLFEDELITALKKEVLSLSSLTEKMSRTSERLTKMTGILRNIVKMTGQIIDILELAS